MLKRLFLALFAMTLAGPAMAARLRGGAFQLTLNVLQAPFAAKIYPIYCYMIVKRIIWRMKWSARRLYTDQLMYYRGAVCVNPQSS